MTDTLRSKFSAVEIALRGSFAERDVEIRGLILAALAREHLLLLGPPGTAKSLLAHAWCAVLTGATFFQWLLTRFSAPEELFGPVTLSGLKEDRFRRATAGKLPEAHVAFLDEVFKGNGAVLNSLLTVLNERAFDNDGGRAPIPLETVVGASNELPEGGADGPLAALYDRFLVRHWVGYAQTPDSFSKILMAADPQPLVTLTLDELHAAQEQVRKVAVPADIAPELFKLRQTLAGQNITASDRRWKRSLRILQAAAWLDGGDTVSPDTFVELAHVLWTTPEQRSTLTAATAKFANPHLATAVAKYDAIIGLIAALPQPDAADYTQRLVIVNRESKRAVDELTKARDAMTGRPAFAKIDTMLTTLNQRHESLKATAKKALGLGA